MKRLILLALAPITMGLTPALPPMITLPPISWKCTLIEPFSHHIKVSGEFSGARFWLGREEEVKLDGTITSGFEQFHHAEFRSTYHYGTSEYIMVSKNIPPSYTNYILILSPHGSFASIVIARRDYSVAEPHNGTLLGAGMCELNETPKSGGKQ